jgi:choline-sulfatase
MDHKIGQLLSALDRLGLTENTLVVYTSDHGDMLFDHGMVQKQNFFEGSARVPLIFSQPGMLPAGEVRHGLASLLDLFPTLCELTGTPAPAGLEGRSLAADLGGSLPEPDRAVFSEYYEYGFPERMIRTGDWKYTYSHGHTPQLYHMARDPLERRNLAGDRELAPVRSALHDRLMAGWEMPDMAQMTFGGPWNDPVEWYAGAEARAGRRRQRRPRRASPGAERPPDGD